MTRLLVTCDRVDGLCRAAVWREGTPLDLYVQDVARPDPTGALVCGKAVRVTAKGGAAWFDAALETNIYVENVGALRVGERKRIRVRTTCGFGKASVGVVEGEAQPQDVPGLIAPPPRPWERAFLDHPRALITYRFAERDDLLACQKRLSEQKKGEVQALPEKQGFPELDELWETLLAPRVAFPGGELVVERTEAFTVVDVNAAEGKDPVGLNVAAMREVARQIRLRNSGGIVVVDALKMKGRTDKAKVLAALERLCADDPAGVNIFGMTKLGLVELTRTRRGPSLDEIMER